MVMRLTGLASGMDIDQMVTDLMKANRMKVDAIFQKKQVLEWKRDDYRDINTKLLTLRNSAFNMKLQSSFSSKTATSSNTNVLTATAGGSAVPSNYSITVHNLASGVSRSSTETLAPSYKGTGSERVINSLGEQFGLSGNVTFTLEGMVDGVAKEESFTFDTATANINNVVKAINDAGIGINASYDSGTERFFLMTSGSGSETKIHVKADAENFLTDNLKLAVNVGADDSNAHMGIDATIDFNDATGLKYASNQFTLNGINFDLKSGGGQTVTVNVARDIDAAVDNIKAFVELYNSTIDGLNTKLTEKRHRDFPPLTDAQKEEMSEKEIEKWEEKARSGILSSDQLLSSAYNKLRSAAMSRVEVEPGVFSSLSAIGINTQIYTEKGKLHIDETKLREALINDPDKVMSIFTN
ncbi:MAG: flagellar filament capping protein FliD [Syntrophomonadaceae bacterium]|nr:flagellar filament capping protein FliD [Syntrophomonadaceae bacterium]